MTCSRAGRASMARPAKPACSVTPRSRSSRAPARAPREVPAWRSRSRPRRPPSPARPRATARRFRAGRPAAASLRLRRAGTHAGLRQHELHPIGRLHVAGDRRRDRAHLLVAGQQQEGRRPPVALDADRVEAGLGMGQLAMAVRRHGAAGMLVRVDQRPERLGAFQPRIELEPQLARELQVRALARRHDDPVDRPDLAACPPQYRLRRPPGRRRSALPWRRSR